MINIQEKIYGRIIIEYWTVLIIIRLVNGVVSENGKGWKNRWKMKGEKALCHRKMG